jgi:hypothetical protein
MAEALEEEVEEGQIQRTPGCQKEEEGGDRRRWVPEEAAPEGAAERKLQVAPQRDHARVGEREWSREKEW